MIDNAISHVSAAVLAGGQSRRMGVDKALLQFEGVPLLKRVLEVLDEVSNDVFIVGSRPDYYDFGTPVFADSFPGTGPLGGIATALKHANHDFVLVVACDMPWLSADLLRALVREPRTYQALVPVLVGPGGARALEGLHAVYAKSCLDSIVVRLEAGTFQVARLFDDVETTVLDEGWMRHWDPELRSFVNTNNRHELAEALAYGGPSHAEETQGDMAT